MSSEMRDLLYTYLPGHETDYLSTLTSMDSISLHIFKGYMDSISHHNPRTILLPRSFLLSFTTSDSEGYRKSGKKRSIIRV